MTETQAHISLTADFRLIATVLTPLALAGAVIAALREARWIPDRDSLRNLNAEGTMFHRLLRLFDK